MNTRKTRLTLLGLAFGILLALLIVPQTRWLVRAQLFPLTLLPGHQEQQTRLFVQQHPNDYQIQLAGKPSDSALTAVEYDRSLVPHFPDSASLRANILRNAMFDNFHVGRSVDFLLGGQPVPSDYHDNTPPSPVQLAAFEADADAGERLDPDNAYFPFMRAASLFSAHRDSEAYAAVQLTSEKHVWREYTDDEVQGHWRINDAIYGGREALSAGAVAASELFPHYAGLRASARIVAYKAILDEQAGHPEEGLALRQALGRCGELMEVQSTPLIGSLVGAAINMISRTRPGGALPLKRSPNLPVDQVVRERLTLYCTYATQIGHPEAAVQAQADYQTWQQFRSITSKAESYVWGTSMTDFIHLAIALGVGWVLWTNILSLSLLNFIAVGLSRVLRIQVRRSLPAGAALGVWSAIVIVSLLTALFFNAGPKDFGLYAIPAVLTLLVFAAMLVWSLPRLRRPLVIGLLAVGITVGVIGLFGALAFWQMHEGIETVTTFLSLVQSSGNYFSNSISIQTLLVSGFGLAIPLLCVIVLSIVSRVKRVPVSVGLVSGFRTLMPPLVFGLMLVYGGLILWTVRQEARANYGMERSLHGEGQYLAQITGETWPKE
ncbi:MAG: hypothetical protein ACRYFS_01910 [Janthinobacterium lividum]